MAASRPLLKLFAASPWRKKILTGGAIIVGTGTAVGLYRSIDCLEDVRQVGIIRFGRAARTVSCIVADYKYSLYGVPYPSDEYVHVMKSCHLRCAARLLDLAAANGGVFVKVGQHVAALEYLIPKEYTKTLSVLMNKAPESTFEDVRGVVEEDLGMKLEEIFSEFAVIPVGAASLAQVHVARLRETGEKVAVKVQHRRVKKNARTDINTMQIMVNITDFMFPDFKLQWLVDEVKKNLPLELDFLHEASNAEKMRSLFGHLPFLKVPTMKLSHSSSRVLTMEFCEGEHINKIDYLKEKGIDTHDVCRKLGRLISEMIFQKGYLHSDPHPGNILVHKKDNGQVEIVILDHGLYLTIEDTFRRQYSQLWLALLNPNQDEIKRVANDMGVGELYGLFACIVTRRSWKSVTSGVSKRTMDDNEKKELRAYAVTLIPQISQVLQRMPREMLLILKTNDLLRAIEHQLGSAGRSDGYIEMSKCVVSSYHHLAIQHAKNWRESLRLRLSFIYMMSRLIAYDYFLRFNSYLPRAIQFESNLS
ncbi:hypothetical protein PRIPAC_71055 [Pristionchus pacificus]|uniref:Protein kinase domain-containing protein n=1 Tax=Pristionchus pacificus TaxID=54126 RepID=A0A2A6CSY7_PRIPA|nr:hypothetical protein PRIPAC_71055 [Pristionchus pacificus]|eukprot:PDM81230.1 hypothetical protein PRIPAC_36233 [Pristionchus pacificus]